MCAQSTLSRNRHATPSNIFRLCEEALAWTSSQEAQETSLEGVAEKKAQFEETMDQYLVKLAPPPSAE